MALPTGQISFADLYTEQALPLENASFVNMFSYASIYGVSFTTDGTNPASMNEFWGKEAPRYDVYEGLPPGGLTYYYVPFSPINPMESTFGDVCFTKLTFPAVKYGDVLTTWPSAAFLPNAGPQCGSGGGEQPL